MVSKSKKREKKAKSEKKVSRSARIDLSKKQIIAGIIAIVVILLAIALPFALSKSPMSSLISFAKADKSLDSFKRSTSIAIISASDGESEAETFRSTGDNLNEALTRVSDRVKASEKYESYIYFRLDVAPFSTTAANDIVNNFPEPSEHSYFIISGLGAYSLVELSDPKIDDVEGMLLASNNYLAGQIQEDGEFIYGYEDLETGKTLEGYSIPRHSGTIVAMLSAYSIYQDEWVLSKIESALDYLEQYTGYTEYDDYLHAYIADHDEERYRLVSSALSTLAFAEYVNKTGSDQYNNILRALVNGINELRATDDNASDNCGSSYLYFQELDNNFEIDSESTSYSRWYDGQATYALVKASYALGDEALLDEAKINLDDFIALDFASDTNTHWTVYAVAEYLKARPDSDAKYYQIIIDSVKNYLIDLKDSTSTSPTKFESITLAQQIVNQADDIGIELDLPEYFRGDLREAISNQLALTAKEYRPIAYTIFYNKPSEFAGAFETTSGQSRIDDNQHRMSALFNYLQFAKD